MCLSGILGALGVLEGLVQYLFSLVALSLAQSLVTLAL